MSRRSEKRQFWLAHSLSSILQRHTDILILRMRKVGKNLPNSHTIRDHAHHRRHGYVQATDTGHAAHLVQIDGHAHAA